MSSRLATTRRGEQGAIVPLTVIVLAVLLLATALTVDVGLSASTNRDLQSVSDLAAIDASRTLDGRPSSLQIADVRAAATASAARNGFVPSATDVLDVELGVLDSDGSFTVSGPTEVPTAVRVEASTTLDYLFVPGSRELDRDAIASRQTYGGLSIGSYVASVDTSTIPFVNEILSDQLGGNIDLDLISHQGLADASVTLDELALAAGVGSPEELLSSDFTAAQFFDVMIDAMNTRGDSEALAAIPGLSVLSLATTTTATFQLADVLGVDLGNGRSVGDIEFGVGDLVRGSATVVSSGSLIDFDLPLAVPGIVDGSVRMTIIEGKQSAVGPPRNGSTPGPIVTNSQVRIHVEVEVADVLGDPVRLPLLIDVGTGQAELIGISCGSDGQATLALTDVLTTAGSVRIGDIDDADLIGGGDPSDATIWSGAVGLPNVLPFLPPIQTPISLAASGSTVIGGSASQVPFSPVFDHDNTQDVGGAGLDANVLDTNLTLTPSVLGLPIAISPGPLVGAVLSTALAGLTPVLNDLLQATGIRVGGAEVTVFAADCQAPALVR